MNHQQYGLPSDGPKASHPMTVITAVEKETTDDEPPENRWNPVSGTGEAVPFLAGFAVVAALRLDGETMISEARGETTDDEPPRAMLRGAGELRPFLAGGAKMVPDGMTVGRTMITKAIETSDDEPPG